MLVLRGKRRRCCGLLQSAPLARLEDPDGVRSGDDRPNLKLSRSSMGVEPFFLLLLHVGVTRRFVQNSTLAAAIPHNPTIWGSSQAKIQYFVDSSTCHRSCNRLIGVTRRFVRNGTLSFKAFTINGVSQTVVCKWLCVSMEFGRFCFQNPLSKSTSKAIRIWKAERSPHVPSCRTILNGSCSDPWKAPTR